MANNLVVTPHPVSLAGQRYVSSTLLPGESLYGFLARNAPEALKGQWVVSIGGRAVPMELWTRTFPKHGNLIEARSTVTNRNVWSIIALVVLTYFTFGVAGAGGFVAASAGTAAAGAVYIAGAIVINKVLGPKPIKPPAEESSGGVYSLANARNQARLYQPIPILFGTLRIAPDLASKTYSYFEGDDQYLAMRLTPGINIDRIDPLFIGDTPLASYTGSRVYYENLPGMGEGRIPLWSNVDTTAGGALQTDAGVPTPIFRTTPPNTVRIIADIEFQLFDRNSKGNYVSNQEVVVLYYRPSGKTNATWTQLDGRVLRNKDMRTHRVSLAGDVPPGQYEVQVVREGKSSKDQNTSVSQFNFTSMSTVQLDTATYKGISRIGIVLKATGQLSGTPDEVRCVAYSTPIQMWNGEKWITARTREEGLSNPGAQMLNYIRGFRDADGRLIGGMGLSDMFIDMEAFKAFMLHCKANNYTYDYLLKETRNHDEVLRSISMAGFGQYTNAAGKISVAWAAADQPDTAVVGMATIRNTEFQVDYSLSNTADGIELNYFDRTKWDTSTVRVMAPGVTTMLNPATITAEGVTDPERAAELARYHLGQSLYQTKDITFATDLEHLQYRRMSKLSLSHDLTQWGFSGSVMGARVVDGAVHLDLDVAVPKRSGKDAYIGIRIPGEMTYRVFAVLPFTQEDTTTVTLRGVWPADAKFPGKDGSAPWDWKFCYDFKQNPGYSVRVVSVTPENDLKGAQVAVVPESVEFWTYVKTGAYTPAPNQSSLLTRPVASNLKVVESQVVQGNTVFTELSATFDITGPYDHSDVLMSNTSGEMVKVADTATRTVVWRIPSAGVYTVTIRPFGPDGATGVSASTRLGTKGADAPPVLPDIFDVKQLSGGLRNYYWGYANDTIRSADYAGVEIRYIQGSVKEPVWESMTPVGDQSPTDQAGFHSAPFEASVPVSGLWTFACKAVNTSGRLSDSALVVTRELGKNLGEIQEDFTSDVAKAIKDSFDRDTKEAEERAKAIEQLTGKLEQAAGDNSIAYDKVVAELNRAIADQTAALLNERLDRQAAIEKEESFRQDGDKSLAYQISQVSAGSGTQFDSYKIWYFTDSTQGWPGSVASSWLIPTDADVLSPTGLGVPGDEYRYIKARVKRVGAPTWVGRIGWRLKGSQEWKYTTLEEPSWGPKNVATIDLEDAPWVGGEVDQISLGLISTKPTETSRVELDFVAVGRPAPGASVALIQDLREAMVEGDEVSARERNTLAVQLRGDYKGNDAAQLTSGLIWQERQSRVSETEAISTQVEGLQVELGGKASAQALNSLKTQVTEVDGKLTSVGESVFALDAQLSPRRAGSIKWRVGTPRVYAGAKTVYNVIAEGDQSTSTKLDTLGAQFNTFSSTSKQQTEALASKIDTQATSINSIQSVLDGEAGSKALDSLSTRVSQTEEGLAITSAAVTQVNARLDDTASATSLTGLSSRIDRMGDRVTSNSQALTSVRAEVDGKAAAQTVFDLSAVVSSQGGTISNLVSRARLSVDSNGYIGGFEVNNNGQVVDFKVLADKFQLVQPRGGARTEYVDGTWTIYGPNGQKIVAMGTNV